MAERTIRKRRGADIVSVIRVGDSESNDAGVTEPINESPTIESDGVANPTTIDDYELDGATDGNGAQFVDPASGSGTDSSGGRKRRADAGSKRGRRSSRSSTTETTSSIANLLFTIHFGMSNLLGSEVFAITEDESKELGKAITTVTQLYDLPVIGEKALAWTNLAMVAGKVYAPRFVAANLRKKKKSNVVEMQFETPIAK